MTIDLAKLRELLTDRPDPYAMQPGVAGNCNVVAFDGDDIVGVGDITNPRRAELICAAVNALPALLDLAEAAISWRLHVDPFEDASPNDRDLIAAVDAIGDRKP